MHLFMVALNYGMLVLGSIGRLLISRLYFSKGQTTVVALHVAGDRGPKIAHLNMRCVLICHFIVLRLILVDLLVQWLIPPTQISVAVEDDWRLKNIRMTNQTIGMTKRNLQNVLRNQKNG
jgi:hypothetical protein